MDLIPRVLLVVFGAIMLAGVMFALNSAITGEGRSRRFTDEDKDGEPDEPPAEKARALKGIDTE